MGLRSAAPSPFLTKKPWSYSRRLGVPATAKPSRSAWWYSIILRTRCLKLVAATISRNASGVSRRWLRLPSGSATRRL